ncbi:anhydro-N-acetylmuramic acid kinase [Flavobacterium hibernum]|uniref:Anhydro-N-acetylmuramic acid kinase n=1 Tax=Flavobacterium hibernum TaxID=37752 RepID=A0A0D0F121_9FLAO|nr:anhydro-N-acetylmuramic acid kinase [Flavobacterium hibernum]KIO51657.1 anhydro-N-acetylmuramic acid kinase [Flavobacterium hibernum]OXA85232.1 anhydro-N-acetylmuramic acid kinase [Flavobacterium hibernum]STO11315.1 Anhydro-N-acetylmuramic acid kinase [Flavobacterium hibernum]
MNKNINALYKIAQKETRKIIGLMSGTSLDGLDIALCEISGSGENTIVTVNQFETVDYSEDIKIEIRKVFAKKNIDFQHLVVLNEWIGILHADMISNCLQKWNIPSQEVDLIASHGQTVLHAPKFLHQLEKFPNATLQIGDGDHIAVKTGIITLSDFRQKHIAAGGEGAPLAVYGDYFLFGKRGENRIMLNMGGIANFTFLPASLNPEETFVTDTGTGNTLIDLFVKQYYPEKSYDKDAEIAQQGTVNQLLLANLKDNAFFSQKFPKTIGPELFGADYVNTAIAKSAIDTIDAPDLLATLTRFSAETIAEAIQYAVRNSFNQLNDFKIYMSGGGTHNPLLVKWLKELLPCEFYRSDDLGISGDAKEAVLFAILANETVAGDGFNFGTKKGIPSVTMGKISFPD